MQHILLILHWNYSAQHSALAMRHQDHRPTDNTTKSTAVIIIIIINIIITFDYYYQLARAT